MLVLPSVLCSPLSSHYLYPQLLPAVLGAPELLAHEDVSFLSVFCSFQRHTEAFTGAALSPVLGQASQDCLDV